VRDAPPFQGGEILTLSRDIAAAARSESTPSPESLNHLLERQLADARGRDGGLNVDALLRMVSAHYERIDAERRGVVRSMQLMSDEAQALTREIREQTASHLQAILDNVKDAIITVDDAGRIETVNPTGERLFGYCADEMLGRALDFVLPAEPLMDFLERCATKIDDTHVDLAAHQMWGVAKGGVRVAVEIAVSKASLERRNRYIVCIRDCTERQLADAAAAGERRVFEKIAANAPLAAVLGAIGEVIERVVAHSICAIDLLDAGEAAAEFAAANRVPGGSIVAWSTPIAASDGTTVGTFAVHRLQPGILPARDTELLSRMAQIAGIAIERRAAENALRASEVKFRGLFESVMEGVYRTKRDGRFMDVNPAFVQMLGYGSADELSGVRAAALYWYPSDRDSYVRRVETHGEVRNVESVLRRKDGSMMVVVDNGRVVRDKHGRIDGYEGTITDITERRQAETAAFQAKERAQVTLQSIGDAVITTDSQGRIDYMNPVAESLTGWENREAQQRLISEVLTVVDEATRQPSESPVMRCLREGQALGLAEHSVSVIRRGQEITIQDSAAPIRDRAGNLLGAVMVFHDISKERRLHRALHYQASHDALTGLINRREFENRMNAAVESVHADAECRHALLYLDLDQFKLVNDTCGHPAGDLLLKQITGVLQSRVRGGDTLARLGGDEFGILLQNCSLDQALRVAETLRQSIRDYRFVWQEGVFAVGVSIGIVEITGDTANVANAMSAADVACYAAKDQGRNRVQLYKPDDVPERHREMHWVSKLTRACDESRFELFYQPIVPIGAIRQERQHFELMLRLREESGALVAPAAFIPAAERYNLMPSIDRWVVRRALDQLVYRGGQGVKPYTLAVNLSGTSLNDERFLEYLIAELSVVELATGAICFEITEAAAIANLGNVVYFMRELKARGCHFALDDFGSGLSSFMYLKTLPVDYLKIDGQFIENVTRDPVDRSMVEAISQVGKAMHIQTIAERVESADVLLELGRLGVGFAQGFHIAAPQSISGFPYQRH
jgi:diguanylate cyclase (GGDEF)-like protein/PAS domain S-box-containing protein